MWRRVGTDPQAAMVTGGRGMAEATARPCDEVTVQLGDGAREFLKALASEQRQKTLELFAGGVELTVGTVAERLGVSQPAASQQLALLRRGGLLTSRKDGKQVHYRIDVSAVERSLTELQDYLRICCPPEGSC
ncbi:ArsR/SmtB family transcription factor [Actinomadura kijaniata]|uniref:ArsR/SmtB family transcription factor n=1 Tax=Actinomadura kijaniata TaxID=46161 RepID=UPI003F1C4A70